MLNFFHVSLNRHGVNTSRHGGSVDGSKYIPFEFTLKLPPPLRNGIDYGFRRTRMSSDGAK